MMAMPGQLTQVAEAMGTTTDGLYEGLQKGKISMDKFMDKIVELDEKGTGKFQSFSEQARNSTDSIGTAITNLGNRIKKGFATILESIDKAMGDTSLGSVAGLINTLSTSIKNFMTKVGEAIEKNQSFKDFIEKVAEGIAKLQEKIDNLDEEKIQRFLDILIKLIEWAPKLFLIGEAFSILGTSFKALGKVTNTISTLTTGFGKLAGMLGTTSGALLGIIAVIGLVVAALVYLYNTNEDFRNAVQEGWAIVQQVFQTLWEMLQPIFESIKEQLQLLWEKLQPVVDFLKAVLPPIIETIIVVLGTLIATIILIIAKVIEIATKVWNVIVDVITGIVNFFTQTLPNAITSLFNKIKSFIDKVVEVITHLDYYLGYAIGAIIAGIKNKIEEIKNFIFVKIPETIDSIIKWFSELPGKIWEWLKKTIEKFTNFLTDMKNKATDGAKKVSDNILNAIKELPSKVFDIGKNIVEGIWNGINGAVGWLHDRVKGFCDGVVQGFQNNLKIGSPSRVFRDEVGKNIALGIGVGFEDTISKVYQAMENTISSETDKLGKEMTTTGNISIERNANVTSLLNGILNQETTYTSNTILDGKVLTTTVNKINARNKFAQGIA